MALSGGTICSIVLIIWSKTFFKQRKPWGLENENEGSNMETMNFNKTDTPKFCSFDLKDGIAAPFCLIYYVLGYGLVGCYVWDNRCDIPYYGN